MRTLLLMRHAKSSWSDGGLTDHERPLNKRGLRDAPRMGRLLRAEDISPDHIVSSTALRARDTAQRVAEASGYTAEIALSADLYGAGDRDFLKVIRQAPEAAACLLLVSHNPGLEYFIQCLGADEALMPTAAVACFRIDSPDWRGLGPHTPCELVRIWRPKEVGDGGVT